MKLASMSQVKSEWRRTAGKRGYNFGFDLRNLRNDAAALHEWAFGASRYGHRRNLGIEYGIGEIAPIIDYQI